MSVSVVTTVISLSTLTIATAALGMTAWLANVLATGVATGPGYTLNRRWTWGRSGASDRWRELAPFWLLSFAGLALSTIAVGVTNAWAVHAHLHGVARSLSLSVAHLSGFGLLWVVQFVLLDRVLFGRDVTRANGASSSSHVPSRKLAMTDGACPVPPGNGGMRR